MSVAKKPMMAPPCQGTDDITFYRLVVPRAIQQKKFVEYEVEVRAGSAASPIVFGAHTPTHNQC